MRFWIHIKDQGSLGFNLIISTLENIKHHFSINFRWIRRIPVQYIEYTECQRDNTISASCERVCVFFYPYLFFSYSFVETLNYFRFESFQCLHLQISITKSIVPFFFSFLRTDLIEQTCTDSSRCTAFLFQRASKTSSMSTTIFEEHKMLLSQSCNYVIYSGNSTVFFGWILFFFSVFFSVVFVHHCREGMMSIFMSFSTPESLHYVTKLFLSFSSLVF